MNKLDRQLALEREMTGLGHKRIWVEAVQGKDTLNAKGERVHKKSARELEQESRTMHGRGLVAESVETVGFAILTFMDEGGLGRPDAIRQLLNQFYSVRPTLFIEDTQSKTKDKAEERLQRELKKYEAKRQYDSKVIATIGLLSIVDSITRHRTHTDAAIRIGHDLESELRFRHFAKTNPALWEKVFGDLESRESNLERRKAVLIHSMKNDETGKANTFESWSQKDRVLVGAKVLELIAAHTTLVNIVEVQKGRGRERQLMVEPTQTTKDYITDKLQTAGLYYPVCLPTICSPKRWSSPQGGGYYSSFKELRPVNLVKVSGGERGEAHLKRFFENQAKMPLVYRAVNAVQATPWKVNKPVLDVLRQAWSAGGVKIGKMPQKTDITTLEAAFPLPPFKESYKNDEEKMKKFRRERAKIYAARVEQTSRVIQMERLIAMAEKFENEETIYFPTQLDFRGRMYAMPSFLNPQGTDVSKGLLTFARGCKLGASGLRWLLIQAANMWGEDKVSFDDREMWALENMRLIQGCAADPFENRQWMKADKPWQFIAACFEINEAYKLFEPTEYFSHLPISVDGTCNGLQHFAGMLLNTETAKAVNVAPNETPSDIYEIVASRVRDKFERGELLRDSKIDPTLQHAMQREWLEWGFDRKATKRSVMILPYSGTLHASTSYIREYVKERSEDDPAPFADVYKATEFFSQHVWHEIEATVPAAREAMKWLQQVAKVVTQTGSTLNWETPLHFMVEQDNREMDQFRINLMLGKRVRYQPVLHKESERLDRDAQMLGVSPNFVHSLDAACLMLTVNRALDEGIEDFAMVHDSYGVLAGRMDMLYTGLRQAFVDIYQTDVMGDFLNSVTQGVPAEEVAKLKEAMPRKGDFVLESVKESQYFFA